MKSFWRLVAAAVLAAGLQCAHALTILTEENPPLNFMQQGEIAGIATATVKEMLQRAGLTVEIRMLPWSEAYGRAQSDPDTCVYSAARLPARFKLFQWVGPIARSDYSAFALDGFKDKIGSVGELYKYRIGVARDARSEYLRQRGFPSLVEIEKDGDIPSMLTLNRGQEGAVDVWVTHSATAQAVAKAAGRQVKQIYAGILSQEYWMACNLKVPAETVRAMSQALSGAK